MNDEMRLARDDDDENENEDGWWTGRNRSRVEKEASSRTESKRGEESVLASSFRA